MRLVVGYTVFLPSPHDTFPAEWSVLAGDHGALAFAMVIVVVEDDPVVRFLELMSQGAVRKQCSVMAGVSLSVEDRQPGFFLRIESVRRDFLQPAGPGGFEIFSIHVQQFIDGRFMGCVRPGCLSRLPNSS